MGTSSSGTARKRLLIIAEHRRGHGSGHLHRCARLIKDLKGEIDWLLPERPGDGFYSRDEVLKILSGVDIPVRWLNEPEPPYEALLLDRREISREEIVRLRPQGMLVGVDVAGDGRDYCDYVIDTLGTPPRAGRPNISDPGLLHFPLRIKEQWPTTCESVLFVFGGESLPANAPVRAGEIQSALNVRVSIASPLEFDPPARVSRLQSRGDLAERLHEFDVVVTHYGLTAYEALWARCGVVLMNPTRYHEWLARRAGFVTARDTRALLNELRSPGALYARSAEARPLGSSSLASLLNGLRLNRRTPSPMGESQPAPAVERFAERTFFREPGTNVIYMQRFQEHDIEYDRAYFHEEYERQYGRTYLDDFAHIERLGRSRLRWLARTARILRGSSRSGTEGAQPNALDIGCAYGPFLTALRAAGFRPQGIDVSEDAVGFVADNLAIPAIVGDIMRIDAARLDGPFDLITMWYVIEHIPDLRGLLDRVRSLLKPGGAFAFSTPNRLGISGRRDQREFLRRSPDDHYLVLDVRSARAALRRAGFSVRAHRVTGHHPERFGIPLKTGATGGKGPVYRTLSAVSHLAGLGDTFELVAEVPR